MNNVKLTCSMCDEPITGEPGILCQCGDDGCHGCDHGEQWASGCWYLDGERYACEHCGSEHVASVDDGLASLEMIDDPNELTSFDCDTGAP